MRMRPARACNPLICFTLTYATERIRIWQSCGVDQRVDYTMLTKFGPWDAYVWRTPNSFIFSHRAVAAPNQSYDRELRSDSKSIDHEQQLFRCQQRATHYRKLETIEVVRLTR